MRLRKNCLYFILSVLLHSCTSIGAGKLNIIPITRNQLLDREVITRIGNHADGNRVIITELTSKIDELEEQGWLGGSDPENNNIEKHLMYVFYHSLKLRQDRTKTIQDKLAFFNEQNGLMWSAHLTDGRPNSIEFKLKILLDEMDVHRSDNMVYTNQGLSPIVAIKLFRMNPPNQNTFLITRQDQDVNVGFHQMNYRIEYHDIEIDHLLKDNDIIIELPVCVHSKKTRFLDWIIGKPIAIDRAHFSTQRYWRTRYRAAP